MPIRSFKAQGVVACFNRLPGVPEPDFANTCNIDHPQNAPAKFPASYLDTLVWHSSLFQYEVALEQSVPVRHGALASKVTRLGATGVSIGGGTVVGVYVDVTGDINVTDIVLADHNLGYVPVAMVALDGRMLPSGFIVQADGNGLRSVSPWCDETRVYLRVTSVSGGVTLPEIDKTYRVMVFTTRVANPNLPMWSGNSGYMQVARGIIDTNHKYAKQVSAGEAPYSINMGPTIDIQNGKARSATGGSVVTESGYGGNLDAPTYRNIGL